MPWLCAGHPDFELPNDIGGECVGGREELARVVERGFNGHAPPKIIARDQRRAGWLVRLHTRITPALKDVVQNMAIRCLRGPAPATIARVLQFFLHVNTRESEAALLAALAGDRKVYGASDQETIVSADRTLEQSIVRVLAFNLENSHDVRVAFRTEAMEGRGSIAVYDGLSRYDSDWFVEYIEHLVKAAPAQADDIVSSFIMLPDEVDTAALKARVAQARNS